jgi:phosphate uptake regulator
MAQKWSSMLKQALQAFIERDINLAAQIPAEMMRLFISMEQVYRELITHLLALLQK